MHLPLQQKAWKHIDLYLPNLEAFIRPQRIKDWASFFFIQDLLPEECPSGLILESAGKGRGKKLERIHKYSVIRSWRHSSLSQIPQSLEMEIWCGGKQIVQNAKPYKMQVLCKRTVRNSCNRSFSCSEVTAVVSFWIIFCSCSEPSYISPRQKTVFIPLWHGHAHGVVHAFRVSAVEIHLHRQHLDLLMWPATPPCGNVCPLHPQRQLRVLILVFLNG